MQLRNSLAPLATLRRRTQAWDCVADAAVAEAERLLRAMLRGTPPAVLARMVAARCQVAIIGRCQVRGLEAPEGDCG